MDDPYAIFRLEGTEGVIKGTIGLMYNYPTGRPDTLEFMSKRTIRLLVFRAPRYACGFPMRSSARWLH